MLFMASFHQFVNFSTAPKVSGSGNIFFILFIFRVLLQQYMEVIEKVLWLVTLGGYIVEN